MWLRWLSTCLQRQETWVRSLGQEDPLERGKATHSSVPAWRIPWTGAWWATVHGAAEADVTEHNNNMVVVIHIKVDQKETMAG